jgi:two-component sensor histidine kinase
MEALSELSVESLALMLILAIDDQNQEEILIIKEALMNEIRRDIKPNLRLIKSEEDL